MKNLDLRFLFPSKIQPNFDFRLYFIGSMAMLDDTLETGFDRGQWHIIANRHITTVP